MHQDIQVCDGPKELLHCIPDFLTSYSGMPHCVSALSHASYPFHIHHPVFKEDLMHGDTESLGMLMPGPGVTEVAWHSVDKYRSMDHYRSS